MLYHLNELKNAALWPTHMLSEAASILLDSVDTEHSSLYSRYMKASAEFLERSTRIYEKPSFGIDSIQRDNHILSIQEKEYFRKTFCTLREFSRSSDFGTVSYAMADDPIVLIVAPLSGHFATLLRDTVRAMIPFHQTYIIDWEDAKRIDLKEGEFTLETYVDYLLDFIRSLTHTHGGRRIHLIAVCQPSVPVLMAVSMLSLYEELCEPYSMTLMGGPIDTRIHPGKVNQFSTSHTLDWFRQNIISPVPQYYEGAGRKVCPGFILLGGFMNLNPERHQEATGRLFKHLVQGDMESVAMHRKFYDEYRSVMDVPGEYFLDSIYHAFQNFTLPKGEMTWRGYPIKPEAITKTGLITVEGELDDISCPGQTFAAHALCKNIPKNRKSSIFQRGVGHYGIFNGRRWRESIQPKIANFISDQEKN